MKPLLGKKQEVTQAFAACIELVLKNHPGAGPRIKLRLVREYLGMTQKEFATRVGISPVTVRNWESDSRPQPTGPSELFINILAQDPDTVLMLAEKAKPRPGDSAGSECADLMEAI
jgi:DNA-binding transcriptional regulator YiaG